MPPSRALALNAISLYAVALILLAAFAMQLIWNELPCPLCQLQRICFALLAIGPMLNLHFGLRPSHYAVSLLAAVIGAAVAGRQVLLHILPHDPGFGTPMLGIHLYTWAFISFTVAFVAISALLCFDQQFDGDEGQDVVIGSAYVNLVIWIVVALTALNVASAFLECGFRACPDNPTIYDLLQRRP